MPQHWSREEAMVEAQEAQSSMDARGGGGGMEEPGLEHGGTGVEQEAEEEAGQEAGLEEAPVAAG